MLLTVELIIIGRCLLALTPTFSSQSLSQETPTNRHGQFISIDLQNTYTNHIQFISIEVQNTHTNKIHFISIEIQNAHTNHIQFISIELQNTQCQHKNIYAISIKRRTSRPRKDTLCLQIYPRRYEST